MTASSPINPSAAELQAELVQARINLERLTTEYDVLLRDPGAIQEDRDATRELVEVARRHVRDVEQAVSRLESGAYGRCSKCGAEIPPERLAALPDTDTCVRCS